MLRWFILKNSLSNFANNFSSVLSKAWVSKELITKTINIVSLDEK